MPPHSQPTDEPHAWGKMGPGRRFHKLAADLDRAWAACRMTSYERRVLQYVREHTWGVSAPKGSEALPCPVPAPRLASLWRVHRQRINDALSTLARDGLLLKVGGNYLVGKDVASWRGGRITPTDMTYAIEGDDPSRDVAPSEAERKYVSADTGIRVEDGPHDTRIRVGRHGNPSHPTRIRVPIGRIPVSDGTTVHRNAGASEDLEIKKTLNQEGTDGLSDPLQARPAAPDPESCPPPAPSPSPEPDAEVDRRLARWVYDRVLAATGDKAEAKEFGLAVAAWRSEGRHRHHVAAIVNDFFSWQARKVDRDKHLAYVRAIFRNRKEGEDVPPVPAEWKPRPVLPLPESMYTDEAMERMRENRLRWLREEGAKQKRLLAELGPYNRRIGA